MMNTARATRGMVSAPHHLASQAGLRVLVDGGNAIEAMLAAAAAIAVVYPHMNSLGGDNFWLIHEGGEPGGAPLAIDACGAAGTGATADRYTSRDLSAIPSRGADAAITVAGAVSGFDAALSISRRWGGRMSLSRLFEDAVHHARSGVPVSASLSACTTAKQDELRPVPGFADVYLPGGQAPREGSLLTNPALAGTFEHLAARGLDDFYRGQLGRALAAALKSAGAPIALADLQNHRALQVTPLDVRLDVARIYNMPPPTQGLASLMILALFARMRASEADGFDYLHRMVECTKQAFDVRDSRITDPAFMPVAAERWLESDTLDALASAVDDGKASPWPRTASPGDTVWLGAVDSKGRAVSMIQSVYWEFGSGLTLPEHGIVWQNRGVSFSLDPKALNPLMPGRRPFHTIQPALAVFDDGRVMPYGCMGGEGQPQSQAAVFSRYAWYRQSLQRAVSGPRWLLGRTWGEKSTRLKLESGFDNQVLEQLQAAGHDVQRVGELEEIMGHAGALVQHPNGLIEGAADPRGDGIAAGY